MQINHFCAHSVYLLDYLNTIAFLEKGNSYCNRLDLNICLGLWLLCNVLASADRVDTIENVE